MRSIDMDQADAGPASSGSVVLGRAASDPAATLSTPVLTDNEESACN
jgi:hypothetical protein